MRDDDDDLEQSAFLAALLAPGTTAELRLEEEYVGAFRSAGSVPVQPSPAGGGLRRAVRRLGAGGTAVVVAVGVSGGAAAAFTGRLPQPVQQIAHVVIGAPAPDAGRHGAGTPRAPRRWRRSAVAQVVPRPDRVPACRRPW